MEQEQYLYISDKLFPILSSYLNQEETTFEPLSFEDLYSIYRLSKLHNITALVYQALKKYKLFQDPKSERPFELVYAQNMKKHILFDRERRELYAFLQENKIPFLPLKGIVIAPYYFDSFCREFSDNDILFDKKRAKEVKKYFLAHKFRVEEYGHGPHDVYMKEPVYNFEMHRFLFGENEDTKEFVLYFENYLKQAKVKFGYELELSKEDFFIYFTAHTYKHYAISGCGIRTMVDYYLFLMREKELDWDYIYTELDKIGLKDFALSFVTLTQKVFHKEDLSKEEMESLMYILTSGTYGTVTHMVTNKVEQKGKFKYVMYRLFPPIYTYKIMYPWAYASKVGIPVAWFIRLVRAIFRDPRKITHELHQVKESEGKKEKEQKKAHQ